MLRRSMSRATIIATIWRYYSRRKVYNVSTVNYHTALDKYWQPKIFLEILNKPKRCVKKANIDYTVWDALEASFQRSLRGLDTAKVNVPKRFKWQAQTWAFCSAILHSGTIQRGHITSVVLDGEEMRLLQWRYNHYDDTSARLLACDATHWESYMV